MYEHRSKPILSRREFAQRILGHATIGFLILGISLSIGVLGYHYLDELNWVDSLLNASMILGGMGPVDLLTNDAAKLFASAYALFSGMAILAVMGIVLAPVVHRMLHRLHLEGEDEAED